MTGEEFKAMRHELGYSIEELARELRMTGDNAARTIRRWETGEYDIPGPTQIAIECLLRCPDLTK